MPPKIKLGDRVRDRINGFTGRVTGYHQWLYGCETFTVAPEKLSPDGKPIDSQAFDEQRLELLPEVEPLKKDAAKPNGGPADNVPATNVAPTR